MWLGPGGMGSFPPFVAAWMAACCIRSRWVIFTPPLTNHTTPNPRSQYVRNLKAQLRGALRGASAPVTLPSLIKDLGIEGLSSGGGMIGGLVEELITEGSVQGSLKGGLQGGAWTPAVYSGAQAAAVKGFYAQNGWVAYDTARRMGVGDGKAYLTAAFPDGIALETGVF